MSPSSPASWGALQGSVKSARPEHIEKCQQRCRSSVTKSPVYRRARPSRRAYVNNNPAPSPFHCLPVNPGYFGRTSWLSWFSRKKSRGRTGQEATLKQPRKLIFQSWNQIFGQVTRQWAWPTGTTQKESTSSAIYCKITISFGEILIFTSTVLGGLFLQIFKPGFLTFSQWDYHPALPG